MKCNNCGADIKDNSTFCSNCGTTVNEGSKQNYNKKSTYQEKNRKLGTRVIIFLLVLVIMFIMIFVLSFINLFKMQKNIKDAIDDNNYTSSSFSNKNNSTYKVNHAGFKFNIPSNLMSEDVGTALLLANEDEEYVVQLVVHEVKFDFIKSNKEKYFEINKTSDSLNDMKVSDIKEEKINGVECFYVECSEKYDNILMGYANLNDNKVVSFIIMKNEGNLDKEYLNSLMQIIKSAEYTGKSSYMKENDIIDLSKIKTIVQDTMNASNED